MGMPLSCLGRGRHIPSIGSANIIVGNVLSRAGLKIFPSLEGGLSAKAPYVPRGFLAATSDPHVVDHWNLKYPYAAWGVPCGPNHFLALDADRHGKGDGVANLHALFKKHRFDCCSVPVVATPNNGEHYYFKRPVGLGRTRGRLCKAVDVRDNAYVIAPGCKMLDGREYTLGEGSLEQFAAAIVAGRLPDPPEWLLSMLMQPPMPARSRPLPPIDDEALKNQIRGIINKVMAADEGNRNNLLYWMACRFGEMVLSDIIALEVAEMLLDKAGSHIGLSAREIRATAISGLRKTLEGDRDGC